MLRRADLRSCPSRLNYMKQIYSPVLLALLAFSGPVWKSAAELLVVPAADTRLRHISRVDDGGSKALMAAIQYLRRIELAANILDHLEGSSATYTIEVVDPSRAGSELKPAEFDATENVIRWDPRSGLEWKSGQAHSAAIVLMHELAHAYHKDVDAGQYWRARDTRTRDKWGNLEEKRTILEVENPIARALGESERNFHEDNGFFQARRYEVASPTSTQRARARRPAFDYLF